MRGKGINQRDERDGRKYPEINFWLRPCLEMSAICAVCAIHRRRGRIAAASMIIEAISAS